MKTKKMYYVVTMIMVIIMMLTGCETNREREARITKEVLTLEDDSILTRYLKDSEAQTDGIKDKVIIIFEFTLSDVPERLTATHIKSLEKAIGTEATAQKLLETREKLLLKLTSTISKPLKERLYEITMKKNDINSAFWLFYIKPDSLLTRLKDNYYPEKKDIIKDLGYYYEPAMGSSIMKEVIKITPDSAMIHYMNTFGNYLEKNDPQRLQRLFANMECNEFLGYWDELDPSTIAETHKEIFLKKNLKKVDAFDLVNLYGDNVIDKATLLKYMNTKSIDAILSSYSDEVLSEDYFLFIIQRVKTKAEYKVTKEFFLDQKEPDYLTLLEQRNEKIWFNQRRPKRLLVLSGLLF